MLYLGEAKTMETSRIQACKHTHCMFTNGRKLTGFSCLLVKSSTHEESESLTLESTAATREPVWADKPAATVIVSKRFAEHARLDGRGLNAHSQAVYWPCLSSAPCLALNAKLCQHPPLLLIPN